MSLFKNTFNLIGKSYKLGSDDLRDGLDCFTLIINYLRNNGIDIPKTETFKQFNFNNYKEAYLKNPNKLIQIAIEYIKTKTKEIKLYQIIAGDILVIKTKENNIVFGIDAGNGYAIVISATNGVIPLNKNNFQVIGAYRCQQY